MATSVDQTSVSQNNTESSLNPGHGAQYDKGVVRVAFLLVTSLFFLWGLSYGLLDVLNKHFQETLNVSHAQSGLLQTAYFGAYFLWALPASYLMEKAGYKVGIILGLTLYALGALLFIPATSVASFSFFLFALFVIASGLGCLETAANPYVTVLGPHEGAARRINLSQSFNGLGQFIGPLIGGAFFFQGDQAQEAASASDSVQLVYIVIAVIVVLVAAMFWRTPLPDIRSDATDEPEHHVVLTQQKHFIGAVVSQFFYIAAQVGVGAFFINFVVSRSAEITSQEGAYLLSVAMLLLLVGRFSGTALLLKVAPGKLLGIYGAVNTLLVLVAVFVPSSTVSIGALLGVFFFMSIMFPTNFALGLNGLGDKTKRAASFLIMAIVGGAIAPFCMGWLSDQFSIEVAFLIPAGCFAIVTWYGFIGSRLRPVSTASR
ncbi:L-fucose:H+ symporter permease [Terasakiispira papahanaumokuakeensis]|uniref:L-fucose:H+ symporter permease n=1 Tax=Terasakiispira papahanaumokuakeensis TaxID=197479 RepID=A0A1E2VBT1_9GAMM|nr:L-fucose:H+ symporter permease [Terasakiispira papahanaumokuakeensis]ODC04413.1 L-fucose:H+ symporter permease [Terasakiispira papahanaumokuakeensis]